MKANAKANGFIKRVAGASMALFAGSLLLVSCGRLDQLEDILDPDKTDSPQCQALKGELLAIGLKSDAMEAQMKALDPDVPEENAEGQKLLAEFYALAEERVRIQESMKTNNCK